MTSVWLEDGKEVEGATPECWVDKPKKVVRYPVSKVKKCAKDCVPPEENWLTFILVKIKFRSGKMYFIIS